MIVLRNNDQTNKQQTGHIPRESYLVKIKELQDIEWLSERLSQLLVSGPK
jgi:hypothetical protein